MGESRLDTNGSESMLCLAFWMRVHTSTVASPACVSCPMCLGLMFATSVVPMCTQWQSRHRLSLLLILPALWLHTVEVAASTVLLRPPDGIGCISLPVFLDAGARIGVRPTATHTFNGVVAMGFQAGRVPKRSTSERDPPWRI